MNTRAQSRKQEDRVAKKLKGKVSSNSGATDFIKGDVSTEYVLIECKTSMKEVKSTTIKKEWLEKLKEEKFAMNKSYSALAFDFGDGNDYYIIDQNMMEMLHNYIDMQNS